VSLSIYTDYKQLKVNVFVYDMMSFSWLKIGNEPLYKNSASGQGLIEMYIESENFRKITAPSILIEVRKFEESPGGSISAGESPAFDANAILGVIV